MPKRYNQEIRDFIRDHVKQYTERELAEITNEKFGTHFTDRSINSYKKNNGWKGDRKIFVKYSALFPKEITEFILKRYKRTGYQAMAKLLKDQYGREYTSSQIRSYYRNHKLNCEIDGQFKKGNVPPLKGKKGFAYPGGEKGWFLKGNRPHNSVEVGTEIITEDGYHKIKISEPDMWEFVHKIVWRENFGEIPKGMMVSYKDCNKDNIIPENLMLITNREHIELVRRGLRFKNSQYTEAGLALVKLNIKVKQRKIQ